MATERPIDFDSLVREDETETRARHAGAEWGRASSRPVRHDDFTLDPGFEPYVPRFGRVDRFTDRYEDLPVHVTLLEDGVLFGQEFFVCDRRVPTSSDMRLYLANVAKLKAANVSGERLDVPDGPLYLVGASAPHKAFYHWCFQCLPSIALLRDEARRRGRDYRIVLPPLDRTRRRSLELLGVEPDECLTLEPGRHLCGVPLLYTSATSGEYAFQPSRRLIELLAPYRDACLARASADLPRRFYVSRRDAPHKRPLENADELRLALRARGYAELVMSELALEDQVSLFAGAESIVAPHGAGLVNLMFAPASARLVEIVPAHYRHACFFRLAQARRVRYAMVLSDMARENPDEPRHGSLLKVDVGKVLAMLEHDEGHGGRRAA